MATVSVLGLFSVSVLLAKSLVLLAPCFTAIEAKLSHDPLSVNELLVSRLYQEVHLIDLIGSIASSAQ